MKDDTDRFDAANRLRAALEGGRIRNETDRELAQGCLARLLGKVRISLLGPRPRDAVDLANFIVGQPVIPPTSATCLIRIEEGDHTHAVTFYREGHEKVFSAAELEDAFAGSPRLVRVRSDQTALTKVSVNCASAKSAIGLRQATGIAANFTDVAFWITSDLTDEEIETWNTLPRRVRDHGYLMVGPGREDIDEIRDRAIEHFVDVIEVDPLAASAARAAVGGVDWNAFEKMGGSVMDQTIKREVRLINQASVDAAEFIMMRTDGMDVSGGAVHEVARVRTRELSRSLEVEEDSALRRAVSRPSPATSGLAGGPVGTEATGPEAGAGSDRLEAREQRIAETRRQPVVSMSAPERQVASEQIIIVEVPPKAVTRDMQVDPIDMSAVESDKAWNEARHARWNIDELPGRADAATDRAGSGSERDVERRHQFSREERMLAVMQASKRPPATTRRVESEPDVEDAAQSADGAVPIPVDAHEPGMLSTRPRSAVRSRPRKIARPATPWSMNL